MNNFFEYREIIGYTEYPKVGVLVNDDGQVNSLSLCITEDEIWDNESWLKDILFPCLVAYKERQMTAVHKAILYECPEMPESMYEMVLEMLELAKERGWFDHVVDYE